MVPLGPEGVLPVALPRVLWRTLLVGAFTFGRSPSRRHPSRDADGNDGGEEGPLLPWGGGGGLGMPLSLSPLSVLAPL